MRTSGYYLSVMSLEIGSAIKYGIKRPLEKDGLMVLAALWLVMVVDEVMSQTAAAGMMETVMQDQVPGEFDFFTQMAAPLALPIPSSLAWILGLVASIVTIGVFVVGYRTFVQEGGESIPEENYQRNILKTTLHGFVGSIVFSILVVIGLILLIVPGIFLAVSLAFYLTIIALKDVSFVEGLQQSWGLTSGHRFDIFLFGVGLVVVFIVLGIVGAIASAALGFGSPAVGELIGVAFSAYGSLIVIGGLVHAYLQLDEDMGDAPAV